MEVLQNFISVSFTNGAYGNRVDVSNEERHWSSSLQVLSWDFFDGEANILSHIFAGSTEGTCEGCNWYTPPLPSHVHDTEGGSGAITSNKDLKPGRGCVRRCRYGGSRRCHGQWIQPAPYFLIIKGNWYERCVSKFGDGGTRRVKVSGPDGKLNINKPEGGLYCVR